MNELTEKELEQVSGGVRPKKPHRDRRKPDEKRAAPGVAICPQCHKVKLPHRSCPHCGYDDGKDKEDID